MATETGRQQSVPETTNIEKIRIQADIHEYKRGDENEIIVLDEIEVTLVEERQQDEEEEEEEEFYDCYSEQQNQEDVIECKDYITLL